MSRITENADSVAARSVLVIGGSGFIGYHIVHALLREGFRVSVLTRNPDPHRSLFPATVGWVRGDIDSLSVDAWVELLKPFQQLVFAAGADERAEPKGDARTFFQKANVESCEKIFRAAQQTSITHAALLSSVFLQVHYQHPELKLDEHHPYIRSRVEQHRIAELLATDHFILTTLQIPWVFGTAPHLPSQWNRLINYVRSATPLMACRGGINVVAVQSVAEAVVGALRYPTHSSRQSIGDLNMSYQQLVETLCLHTQRQSPQVRLMNERFFHELMQAGGLFRKLFNIPAGLDISFLPDLLMRDIHVDNRESQTLLRYPTGIANSAIQETVLAAPENRYVKGWRQMLNLFR